MGSHPDFKSTQPLRAPWHTYGHTASGSHVYLHHPLTQLPADLFVRGHPGATLEEAGLAVGVEGRLVLVLRTLVILSPGGHTGHRRSVTELPTGRGHHGRSNAGNGKTKYWWTLQKGHVPNPPCHSSSSALFPPSPVHRSCRLGRCSPGQPTRRTRTRPSRIG